MSRSSKTYKFSWLANFLTDLCWVAFSIFAIYCFVILLSLSFAFCYNAVNIWQTFDTEIEIQFRQIICGQKENENTFNWVSKSLLLTKRFRDLFTWSNFTQFMDAVVFFQRRQKKSTAVQHIRLRRLVDVFNPASATFFSNSDKTSLPKRSAPYRPNPLFKSFWHSDTLALSPERQSARMPKN